MELFIIQIVVVAVLLLIVAKIVPGIEVDGFGSQRPWCLDSAWRGS